jgi:hypothetical protein
MFGPVAALNKPDKFPLFRFAQFASHAPFSIVCQRFYRCLPASDTDKVGLWLFCSPFEIQHLWLLCHTPVPNRFSVVIVSFVVVYRIGKPKGLTGGCAYISQCFEIYSPP